MFNILNCALALGLTTCIAVYPSTVEKDNVVNVNNSINYSSLNLYRSDYPYKTYTINSQSNYINDFSISTFCYADDFLSLNDDGGWSYLNLFSVGSSTLPEDELFSVYCDDLDSQSFLGDTSFFNNFHIQLNSNSIYDYTKVSFTVSLTILNSYQGSNSHGLFGQVTNIYYSGIAVSTYSGTTTHDNILWYTYSFHLPTGFLLNGVDTLDNNTWSDVCYKPSFLSSSYDSGCIIFNIDFDSDSTNNSGWDAGYSKGFDDGKDVGRQEGIQEGATASGLFFTLADTPIIMLKSLFNFDFFGVNFFVIIGGLLTILLVLFVIKKFK